MRALTPGRLARVALWRVYRVLGPPYLAAARIPTGRGVIITGFPLFIKHPGSTIRMGDRVQICSDGRFTALGVDRRTVFRTLQPGARISIGDDTGMSGVVICAAKEVSIGPNCLIGANVTFMDTDFHPIAPEGRRYATDWDQVASAPICVESNVFIGAYSRILKGVTIGANSVIGTGSIVTRSIPPNCIAAGNPCRVLRLLSEDSALPPK